MGLLDRVHARYVHPRRVRVLAEHLTALVPHDARVLDVGAGDGLVAASLLDRRPDLTLEGIDVLVRPETFIPVREFDGAVIPYRDDAFDAVLLVDVLHHTQHPLELLGEAARVAGRCVVVKDHTLQGYLAAPTIRFMDRVGNLRHGVPLPHTYWPKERWLEATSQLGLRLTAWRPSLGLYPFPASLVFDRSLHFFARFDVDPLAARCQVAEDDGCSSGRADGCGRGP